MPFQVVERVSRALVGVAAVLLLPTGCLDDPLDPSTRTGKVAIGVEFDLTSSPRASQAIAAAITGIEVELFDSLGSSLGFVPMRDSANGWIGETPQLDPGRYGLVARGLEGDDVGWVAEDDFDIEAGEQTSVGPALSDIVPAATAPVSRTTDFSLTASWTSIRNVSGYTVELAGNDRFDNSVKVDVDSTETSVRFDVSAGGLHFFRVRSKTALTGSRVGAFSQPDSIEVVTDLRESGDSFSQAPDLGFGVAANQALDSLNILPTGDEDWFGLEACMGDTLKVRVRTATADPVSTLPARLALHRIGGAELAADPTAGSGDKTLTYIASQGNSSSYFISVSADDNNSIGHYELEVENAPGANNDGTGCI